MLSLEEPDVYICIVCVCGGGWIGKNRELSLMQLSKGLWSQFSPQNGSILDVNVNTFCTLDILGRAGRESLM